MNENINEVYSHVNKKIFAISRMREAEARSVLARMRRGVGKHPGSTPELWEMTLDGLPEPLAGKGRMGEPTRGEHAVHTALTLFALHQQGHDPAKDLMSKDGVKFGNAVRRIAENEDDVQRVKRRFDAAVTSESMDEFSNHLRGLVQLMRSKDIPMDYPRLAQDLFNFANIKYRDDVRLKWGRDFYRYREENENDQ